MKKLIRAATSLRDDEKMDLLIDRLAEHLGYEDMVLSLIKYYPAANVVEALEDIANQFDIDISDIEEDY